MNKFKQYVLTPLFVSLSIFSFTLLLETKSWANSSLLGNYKVSKKAAKVDQRRSVGSGSRSRCEPSVEPNSVELLVPEIEVAHRTHSENPSLYVYSERVQSNIEFTLIDLDSKKTLVNEKVELSSGINLLKLPENVRLEENIIYGWNIAIPCQDSYSYQTVLNAAIERVPRMFGKQNRTKSTREQIESYTENGIWYESADLYYRHLPGNDVRVGSNIDKFKECFWKVCSETEN